jgi:hypothetical protein
LSFSVLTFIKWRLTQSYAAKDTIFWQKRPKTIATGIIVQDNKISNLFIWPSMWTRLEACALSSSCIHKIWKTIEKRRKKTCSAYLSSKISATSALVWTRSSSLSSFQRSNWSPTYILHLFHLEDTSLFASFSYNED